LALAFIIFVVVFIFNYIIIKIVDFDKLSKFEYINSSKYSSSFGSFDSSTSDEFSVGRGRFVGGGASGRL
ncbi:TPM domain-containing protein, partial [Aliarcobacter butzleri]